MKFGIAGWSFLDWKGIVYPKGCRDTLRHCAQLVDLIEINSTFYHAPPPRNCESWAKRTADIPDFFFTAKLPGRITHEGDLGEEIQKQVRDGFAPLVEADKLRMLLAQFSYRFQHNDKSAEFLWRIADAVGDLAPIALEVRHGSWKQDAGLKLLGSLPMSVVNLDYPGYGSGFDPWVTGMNGPLGLAYFRLHGRNRAWFDRKAGRDEVYDYEYGSDEVTQIEGRVEKIATGTTETIVIANNHYQGKAMKLALQLKAWHRQQKVVVPESMVERFPDLADIAGET